MIRVLLLVFLILILVFNVAYNILPEKYKQNEKLRAVSIVFALIILIVGVNDRIKEYTKYRFALVSSKNGVILKKNNFPWEITKTSSKDGKIIYIINERFGDASEIHITTNKKVKYEVYNAIDGVGIKFSDQINQIPNFKIEIK